jgi:hypothetical protein
LVPLKQARLLSELFPDENLTFGIKDNDLDGFRFEIDDTVSIIYDKYFDYYKGELVAKNAPIEEFQALETEKQRILRDVLQLDTEDKEIPCAPFAAAVDKLLVGVKGETNKQSIKEFETSELILRMAEVVTEPMERILNYKFANKNLLVESLTHRSFKDANNLSLCYEKLEVLGDAILDYIINSNVIDFTIFDRFNIKERQAKEFYTNEDFQPFDAH